MEVEWSVKIHRDIHHFGKSSPTILPPFLYSSLLHPISSIYLTQNNGIPNKLHALSIVMMLFICAHVGSMWLGLQLPCGLSMFFPNSPCHLRKVSLSSPIVISSIPQPIKIQHFKNEAIFSASGYPFKTPMDPIARHLIGGRCDWSDQGICYHLGTGWTISLCHRLPVFQGYLCLFVWFSPKST